jgi:hypothetical protein
VVHSIVCEGSFSHLTATHSFLIFLKERMKEVLQSEQRQYERELEGLGLSSSHMDLAYKVG